ALSLLLAWSRKIVYLNNYIKQGVWDFKLSVPIRRYSKQTLGVFGFGKIPQRLVEKASVFGFNIIVYDPYVSKNIIDQSGAESVSIEELFMQSDFLSVHVPLTEETNHIIDFSKIKTMKNSSVIINTARG